ncbi:HAD-IIA family hydrolase [Desmospora activa]|uniref:Acid sugar phosphatase n=1 Tax=Desmospora activa DSM 45169 TaxID=1121389 RepID=A0A2T4ZBK8_9BACL|nr:HAD-IIA family hydrolase [Desmospora activa]PTM59291.1 arabinose operon protein AraL/NagD protein [Desmospora activa DSM 45169]
MKGFIFDLDGTIYLGERAIPGAAEAVNTLLRRGDRVVFLSNKPIATRRSYVQKLNQLGIPAEESNVIHASMVTARLLKERLKPHEQVLVIGERPIREELREHGVKLTYWPDQARYVLLSWDRDLTYEKLNRAYQAWRHGAELIASNPDRTCPVEGGELPDTAALIGAMEALTGERIRLVAGKPSLFMAQAALEVLKLSAADCWMVGDRLETDIRMAVEAGMRAALVLTGVSTRSMVEGCSHPPDRILDSVAQVVEL